MQKTWSLWGSNQWAICLYKYPDWSDGKPVCDHFQTAISSHSLCDPASKAGSCPAEFYSTYGWINFYKKSYVYSHKIYIAVQINKFQSQIIGFRCLFCNLYASAGTTMPRRKSTGNTTSIGFITKWYFINHMPVASARTAVSENTQPSRNDAAIVIPA